MTFLNLGVSVFFVKIPLCEALLSLCGVKKEPKVFA